MLTEDQLALVNEIVPRTLRSLFVLRITLCAVVAGLAVVKIACSAPFSSWALDILASMPSDRPIYSELISQLNLLSSGLLACALALVIATFFIQARIRSQAEQELNIDAPSVPSSQP